MFSPNHIWIIQYLCTLKSIKTATATRVHIFASKHYAGQGWRHWTLFVTNLSASVHTHIHIIYVSVYVFGQLTVVQHGMYLPHILLHHCYQYD